MSDTRTHGAETSATSPTAVITPDYVFAPGRYQEVKQLSPGSHAFELGYTATRLGALEAQVTEDKLDLAKLTAAGTGLTAFVGVKLAGLLDSFGLDHYLFTVAPSTVAIIAFTGAILARNNVRAHQAEIVDQAAKFKLLTAQE